MQTQPQRCADPATTAHTQCRTCACTQPLTRVLNVTFAHENIHTQSSIRFNRGRREFWWQCKWSGQRPSAECLVSDWSLNDTASCFFEIFYHQIMIAQEAHFFVKTNIIFTRNRWNKLDRVKYAASLWALLTERRNHECDAKVRFHSNKFLVSF